MNLFEKANEEDPSHPMVFHLPTFDELVSFAEKVMSSCVHHDQVNVAKNHIMHIAQRGVALKRYSHEEGLRIKYILDHFMTVRFSEIGTM